MLSVERVKELLNDPKISDKEVEEIRDDFNILAEMIFEKWLEEKKKEKENKKTKNKKLTREEINKIEDKAFRLRFREVNRDIFDAIRNGRKTIETRAATVRYQKINKGDRIILVCGKDLFEKHVVDVQLFRSIDALLKKYKVWQINPNVKTEEELRKLYHSFPGYREKIKKHGLIAIELR